MKRFLSVLCTCVLLSFPLGAVEVRVSAAAQTAWDRLVAAHPVPSGVESGAIVAQDVPQGGALPGFKAAGTIVMVPVARFWDVPPAVPRAAAESGDVRLLPIETVTLPDIALPVDGLYPGDQGYPLIRDLAIGISGDDPALVRWFESLPDPAETGVPRIVWIGAVGDIMPARGVDASLMAEGGNLRVFGDTLPVLKGLDLLVGNLEAAATWTGVKTRKTYTFRFDPHALKGLAAAGFSYLSLANNHTFDYGRDGFVSTLENVVSAGIATSGAGLTDLDAARPAVLNVEGMEVRLLSFAAYPVDRGGFDGRVRARAAADRPGTLWLDDEGIAAAARGFSPRAFNIALVHGGVEWSTSPTAGQRRGYRELVSAGADLVIGSHPHVLQGLEAIDGRLIAYSLGNFLFPGMEETQGGESSAVIEIGAWNGKIVTVRVVPVRLHGATVRLDRQQGATAAIRSLSLALNAPR